MLVKDVMTPRLIGVNETASLWDALNMMVESRVSALVVFDAIGRPVGILSEGDLMRRAEFGAEKRQPRWLEMLTGGGRAAREYARSHGRLVFEVMTRGIHAVDANAELSEAVEIMLEKKVRRLMVVKGSEPVGIISRSDLVRALIKSLPPEAQSRSDADLEATIADALARESWTPIGCMHVSVHQGVASLEGSIPDESLREGLKVLVENVAGVKSVRDRLAWIEPNSGIYITAPDEP